MIFPALGIIIAGVVAVGSAVGTAAIFRSRTGHWRPVASAVLALLPALCFWPPVFMGLPAAFSRFTVLGPVGVGVIVGALATLTMPARWKLVGAVSAAIVTIVIVATLLPIAIETLA